MTTTYTANDMKTSRAFTLIELLVVVAIIGILIALLLPAVQAAREMARRLQCVNHQTQIGIALKNYELNRGMLPSGTVDEKGPIRNVPLGNHMGWIPRILPYMEQSPLYEMIDFHHGVYDPENRDAWTHRKPSVLSCPSDGGSYAGSGKKLQHSSFMACHGGEETAIDVDNNGVFFLNSKLRSRDIFDGTSNTIFLGESVILSDDRLSAFRLSNSPKILLPEDPTATYATYRYGSLGWMSGTPGTLRNTGNPPQTLVGPFADWALPEDCWDENYHVLPTPDWDTADMDDETGEIAETSLAEATDGGVDSDAENVDGTEETEENSMGSLAVSGGYHDSSDDDAAKYLPLPASLWAVSKPGEFIVGGYSSYHTGGVNHLFGDGSARLISSMIDPEVYSRLGNRADGHADMP